MSATITSAREGSSTRVESLRINSMRSEQPLSFAICRANSMISQSFDGEYFAGTELARKYREYSSASANIDNDGPWFHHHFQRPAVCSYPHRLGYHPAVIVSGIHLSS